MEERVLRKPEVIGRSGMSGTTIWRLEKSGKFPRRVKLGGAAVGWMASEFESWLAERTKNRVQLAGGRNE